MIISHAKSDVATAVLVTISVSVSVPTFAHDSESHTHETPSSLLAMSHLSFLKTMPRWKR
jgi:hypothetical protein